MFHFEFRNLLSNFKVLHDQSPNYIKDLLTPNDTRRPLRSAKGGFLVVPRARFGDWRVMAFAKLRSAKSITAFKSLL